MLYGYKWTSINGEEFEERSHAGQVWLQKTEDLTDQQWFKAVSACEKRSSDRARDGQKNWPPSYEEFVTYAKENENRGKVFVSRLPEPKEIKSKRKREALKKLDKIKSIFDE